MATLVAIKFPVGWNWTAFIVAVLGAVLLLAVLNVLFGHRGT